MAAAVAAVAAVAAEPVAEDGEEAAPVVAEEEIQVLVVEHHQVKLKFICCYFIFPDILSNLRLLQHQVVEGSFSKPCAQISVANPQLAIDQ